MDSVGYSKDVDSLRDSVEIQKRIHQEIVDFHRELEEFRLAKVCKCCVVFRLHRAYSAKWSTYSYQSSSIASVLVRLSVRLSVS